MRASDSIPVWTNEQWEKAKDGLDYTEPGRKKEIEEVNSLPEPTTENRDTWADKLNRFFTSTGGKAIALLLLLSLLAYTLFRLMSKAQLNKNRKIHSDLAYYLEHIEEHFEESDMDRLLRLAVDSGDLKTAVRVLYLRLLWQLHERRWIIWKKDKTNHDFLLEMRSRKSYRIFNELTLAYEIIWYGDTEVDASGFDVILKKFNSYGKMIEEESNEKK
jgi:hypothetical protein